MRQLARSSLFNLAVIVLVVTGFILMIWFATSPLYHLNSSRPSGHSDLGLQRFDSDAGLVDAYLNSTQRVFQQYNSYPNTSLGTSNGTPVPVSTAMPTAVPAVPAPSTSGWYGATFGQGYSTTNVQVAGVDEADIVKTDGRYIYLVTNGKLDIVKAYPAPGARIISTTAFDNFYPQELFISDDRLLVFGSSYISNYKQVPATGPNAWPYWQGLSVASARLYDISDPGNPSLIKQLDLEGNYVTARMIGNYAYFLVNTYPQTYSYDGLKAWDIIPVTREGSGKFLPVGNATDIYSLTPGQVSSFVTICSMSMRNGDLTHETLAGSGQEVYASQDNLYFTYQTGQYWPYYYGSYNANVTTSIVKLHLDQGTITAAGTGEVAGHPLNQFSMDEYAGYFRIATTQGYAWTTTTPSTSNIYVLDDNMKTVGSLEGLAPGEQIYSTRFAGSRCYLVTFKKVDPLFVIDLSDPKNPKVLGKLKIPGYSDYLHPYDDTHIIGIGKDTVDASESESSSMGLDFAWYQGVKMAMFDVSDVEHPKELYKVVIGDRGTDSPVLTDHRAFLFDQSRGLLVLPVRVAEIQGTKTSDNQYGNVVFDGAYVYDVSLSKGFVLRGNVTQHEPGEKIDQGWWYYYNNNRSIQRSLYIGNVLYTLSQSRLQLNDLKTLEKLKAMEL